MNPLPGSEGTGAGRLARFPRPRFPQEGGLRRLVEQDGLAGVTSNPSIFEKAIGESPTMTTSCKHPVTEDDASVMAIYEALAIDGHPAGRDDSVARCSRPPAGTTASSASKSRRISPPNTAGDHRRGEAPVDERSTAGT